MSDLAQVAGVVGALGLAAAIVAPRWGVRVAGLVACIAGELTLALELAPAGHAGPYAGVGIAVAVAAALLAVLFVRVSWAVAPLALACVPAYVAVDVGGAHGRLLVPLYVVVAGAALALLWRPGRGGELGLLAWPLGLLVAWAGASVLWSDDPHASGVALVLFVLPLGLLALALARVEWRSGLAAAIAFELVGIAIGLAIAGGVQYLTRNVTVGIDQTVVSGWYFRVAPLFHDAGAYALFLAVATSVALVVAVRVRGARAWAPALAATVVLWLGLWPAFSRPAFVALGTAAVALLVAVWWPRAVLPAALVLVAAAVVAGSLAAARVHVVRPPGGGPVSLHGTVRVARDHPLAGVGLGARAAASAPAEAAAELGVPGFLLLAALVAAGLGASLRGAQRPLGLALGLALVVLAVDSAFRGSLLADPLFYGVIGLIAACARRAPSTR